MKILISILSSLLFCLNLSAQESVSDFQLEALKSDSISMECDSINIPVILVDGVEVQNIDNLQKDDIEEFKVVKDPAITKYFKPRLGGVIIISTKSKQNLKSIIRDYEANAQKGRENRRPGELLIR